MNSFRIILLAIGLLSLSSCSKNLHYFTDRMQNEYDWKESELKQIQFYLSDDIVLSRSRRGGRTDIKDGKIQVKNDGQVEEIRFKKGTPGTVVFSPQSDRVAVSFEAGADKFLMFGPNKKANGRFVLLAKEWDKNVGKITYDGRTYNTTSESAYAALLVQLKGGGEVVYKSRSADGSKVRSRR